MKGKEEYSTREQTKQNQDKGSGRLTSQIQGSGAGVCSMCLVCRGCALEAVMGCFWELLGLGAKYKVITLRQCALALLWN
ncbi:hypothetical protein PRUPE_3G028600 [Prunus persica]|uniref:Uncharacterized protein n=1 Tax=Prunus persica TaxID=3760 RepID=A0A251PUK5_PRUPE|nr:hypothetical protein PRUPE_3G028600 [Prunus persica]